MAVQRQRRLLAGAAASAVLVLSGCTNKDESVTLAGGPPVEASPVYIGDHEDYVTRPDLMEFEADVDTGAAEADAHGGKVMLSPRNEAEDEDPVINVVLSQEGEPVWLQPAAEANPDHNATNNLQVQTYRGEPVLTWWEGVNMGGYGYGEVVMVDTSYNEIARVSAGGLAETGMDFHESRITEDDTLLWVAYVPTQTDLRSIGGPEDGWVTDGVVQEVVPETGEILFEWSALDHVPVEATMYNFEEDQAEDQTVGLRRNPFDYFHINSAAIDAHDDGSILVSARNTHGTYSIDRGTGELNWTLGGSESDFDLSEEAYFAWQHDIQREADGTLRILDNASEPAYRENSRVLWLELDEETGNATITDQLEAPEPRLADYMANAERLDNGNLMVGWGSEPYYTEYNPEGEVVHDAEHGPLTSYRAYTADWTAQPEEPPTVTVKNGTAYVSWNGATEVAHWRILTGQDEATATQHDVQEKDGFETSLPVTDDPYVAVQALDESGEVLGASYVRDEDAPR